MGAEVEAVLRLLLAALLGGIVGFQRETVGKEAGVRTNMLISAGAAIFTVASVYGFPGGDPSRLAAGVITGVGFIGAGVILHSSGGAVVGLTTAATMWAVAGIEVAAGARPLPAFRGCHARDAGGPLHAAPAQALEIEQW